MLWQTKERILPVVGSFLVSDFVSSIIIVNVLSYHFTCFIVILSRVEFKIAGWHAKGKKLKDAQNFPGKDISKKRDHWHCII